MKSIAWAILLATAFSWAEYREIYGKIEPDSVYGALIVTLFLGFLASLVP